MNEIIKPSSSYAPRPTLFGNPYCKCGHWLRAYKSCSRCWNCGAVIDWSTFEEDEHKAWCEHYEKLKQIDEKKSVEVKLLWKD